jgi:hypothetical protein
MLAALNLPAVGLGLAGGGLTTTVLSLAVGGALSLAGVGDGADIGLLVGVVGGLFAGGWLGGRMAAHSHRFHGSVVGLLLAGLIIALAGFGNAPVSVVQVLTLALVALVIAGVGGWLGGRRRSGIR